jgi:hypothetical protein
MFAVMGAVGFLTSCAWLQGEARVGYLSDPSPPPPPSPSFERSPPTVEPAMAKARGDAPRNVGAKPNGLSAEATFNARMPRSKESPSTPPDTRHESERDAEAGAGDDKNPYPKLGDKEPAVAEGEPARQSCIDLGCQKHSDDTIEALRARCEELEHTLSGPRFDAFMTCIKASPAPALPVARHVRKCELGVSYTPAREALCLSQTSPERRPNGGR